MADQVMLGERASARLPLARVGSVVAPAGTELTANAQQKGVIVSSVDALRMRSHDLAEIKWETRLPGWAGQLQCVGGLIWAGVIGGEIYLCSAVDGSVVDAITSGPGEIRGVCGEIVLVASSSGLTAFDRRRGRVWSRDTVLVNQVAALDDAFLVAEESGATVACLDAATGEQRWQIRIAPKDAPHELKFLASLPAGFPSLQPVDGGVVMINGAGDVMVVSAEDGALVRHARSPLRGFYAFEQRGIQFMTTEQFLLLDWRTMAEVERQSYAQEVGTAQKTAGTGAHGFVATAHTIVWSVPHGTLMAVERRAPPEGPRRTWSAKVGGLMPICRSPQAWGQYVYWVTIPQFQSTSAAELIAFGPPRQDQP